MDGQSDIACGALMLAESLAGVPTVGALIDRTLNELARVLESPLVSLTEIDLVSKTAATSFRRPVRDSRRRPPHDQRPGLKGIRLPRR